MINDKLKVESVIKDGKKQLLLKGVIDEDTDFTPIIHEPGSICLNLGEVTGINSLGIRGWVNFLKELGSREVSYEACPPLIVRQMNMVPSFVGHAKVLSVFVPYVCDNCGAEKLLLVKEQEFAKGAPALPNAFTCETCKEGEMEFDGHPQQYFAFRR